MAMPSPIMKNIISLDKKASYSFMTGILITRRNIKRNKFRFDTVSTIGSILRGKLLNNLITTPHYP